MELLTRRRDWGRVQKAHDASGRLRCSMCREWKDKVEFNKNATQKTGLNYSCRSCSRTHTRKHRLRRKYGITEARYQEMVASQGGRCACCGEEFQNDVPASRACVDHNHATGAVRDVLCGRCNLAAGNVLDSSRRAMQVVTYLQKWNC